MPVVEWYDLPHSDYRTMVKLIHCLVFTSMFGLTLLKNPNSKPRLGLPGRLAPKYEYLQNCGNVSGLSARITKPEIERVGSRHEYVLNADIIVEEEVRKIEKLIVRIQKCEDATVGTCQQFTTWRFNNDMCGLMVAKGQVWTSFIQSMSPPVKCPIKCDCYHMRNATADMGIISHLPLPDLEKYFWRGQFEGYHPHMNMCLDVGVRFYRTRT